MLFLLCYLSIYNIFIKINLHPFQNDFKIKN